MKNLTSSVYTFEDLIEGDYLYVDKTALLWPLIRESKGIYFLARPRRFGKSLTISTLKAAFQGKRELFKGLALDATEFDWRPRPVIHLDLGGCAATTAAELKTFLTSRVDKAAAAFGIEPKGDSCSLRFQDLVETLGERDKVVILVDEYDKPLIDNLDNPQVMAIRQVMDGFYNIIKATEPYQRFVLLTGVSKFSQVSVFSKLNNLRDLSMDVCAGTLLGYTQQELEVNFADRIDLTARALGMDKAEMLDQLREWYNGYCFNPKCPTVYNPVSIAKFFESGGEFKNYWFATGTPSFLLKLLKRKRFDFELELGRPLDELAFAAYDVEHLEALPLLLQTGYLTIKGSERVFGQTQYRLGFPNREVESAFNAYLLEEFGGIRKERSGVEAASIARHLLDGRLDEAMAALRAFFAGVPYDLKVKAERYYQTIFYTVFRLLGIFVQTEVKTSDGRVDAVVQAGGNLYVFEFKLDAPADAALEQIRSKDYPLPYQAEGKRLFLVGVSFDTRSGKLGEWKVGAA